MKNVMKKLIVGLLSVIMVMSLCACGSAEESPYAGKYISVAGSALGMTLTGEDVSGFAITLENGGKGSIDLEDESGNIKWTEADGTITLKVDGQEVVGTIGQDTLEFEDMLGMGLDLIFAKEGTDAANPELYLPEEEKALLGDWKSVSVADVLGEDASAECAPDNLELIVTGDHQVTVKRDGAEVATEHWYALSGEVYLECEVDFHIEDGKMIACWRGGDDYFVYTCEKQ